MMAHPRPPASLLYATGNQTGPIMCRYVSFPVQTLGKCAKILPVMAWGTVIMHKRCNPNPCAQEDGVSDTMSAQINVWGNTWSAPG